MINLALRGIHPDYIPIIPATLIELDKEYPGAVQTIRTYSDISDKSLASEEAGTIRLNLYWFGKPITILRQAALLGNAFQHGVDGVAAWHDSLREPDHTLTHEMGHAVRSMIGKKALDFANELFNEALNNPVAVATGYALVNAEELFAETFAVFRVGREHSWAGDHAQKMREFLKQNV